MQLPRVRWLPAVAAQIAASHHGEADAELIVYGATEPSASLFIGDQQVTLEADGTFRVQVPFRDGEQLYPIRAIAADREQERSIRMEFERRTPEAHVNSREEAQLAWF